MKTSSKSKNPSYLLHTRYGYYFRLRVPADLVKILGHEQIKISVMTGRAKEARQRAIKLYSCVLPIFQSMRQGNEMGIEGIKRVLRRQLRDWLEICSVMDAARPVDVGPYLEHVKGEIDRFKRQLDENDFSEVREPVLHLIESEGMRITEDSLTFNMACREYLKNDIIWHEILVKRTLHDHVYESTVLKSLAEESAIPEAEKKTKPDSRIISEMLPLFLDQLERDRKSESYRIDCKVMIGKVLTQILGDIPVSKIETSDISDFIDVLRAMPQNFTKKKEFRDISPLKLKDMKHETTLGQSRVRTVTFMLSSFFQFCIQKGQLKINPVVKGMAGAKPKKKGSSWSVEDLHRMFYSKEYLDDLFEEPYQFWIPILGLFTGARHKEIAQLYVEDIVLKHGVWGITIEDDPDDAAKTVKTETSKRFIPLHDFILNDLGFVRYVDEVKALNQQRIFFCLKKWKAKGYRGQSSKWFGGWTKQIGVKENGKKFHSFRHWFRTYLENVAKLNAYDIAPLLGHSDQKLMTLNYGEVWASTLYERIMRIDYKKDIELDLAHLKNSRFARPERSSPASV